MAAEFIKNCCKGLLSKEPEPEPEVFKEGTPPARTKKSTSVTAGDKPPGNPGFGKRRVGCSEDYLLSKLPPDGREVPFVVPTFKPSYIQPSHLYLSCQEGLQEASAGTKGSFFWISSVNSLHCGTEIKDPLEVVWTVRGQDIHTELMEIVHAEDKIAASDKRELGSARSTFTDRKAELSGLSQVVYDPDAVFHPNYMLDHISPGSARRQPLKTKGANIHGSAWDLKSSKTLASVGLSGSSLDLGPLQGHMQRYDSMSSIQSSTSSMRDSQGSSRSLESITLSGDERELGKLNVKLCYQEPLEQIWITVVKCKDLYVPDGELHKVSVKGIITLAKPVQFRSSIKEGSPNVEFMETFVFALKLQQLQTVGLVFKVQTHNPRKRTLGECSVTLRKLSCQEIPYWLDISPPSKAPICHAELHIATCFQPVSGRIQIQILGAQNLPSSSTPLSQSFFIKAEMYGADGLVTKKKTRAVKSSGGQARWGETFLFPVAQQEQGLRFTVRLYSRSSVRRKHFLGQVLIGCESTTSEALEQWRDTATNPEKVVAMWHKLSPS